ncbi:hypothetical protein FACS189498_0690 [Spirochaetia bacterium]|nr:hypothetical protein FACS189498_0690 [Spirochaetia bacterium]
MDSSLYLLAELDNDTQIKIKEIEEIIIKNGFSGKQTKNIPYHITLGNYKLEQENNLKELLKNIKQKYKEIEISFNSIGLFGLNVLFLNPDMNIKLMELYKFVNNISLEKYNNWTPHTTIIIDEPEILLKVLPIIAEKCKNINGKIKGIGLYEFFPTKFIDRCEL